MVFEHLRGSEVLLFQCRDCPLSVFFPIFAGIFGFAPIGVILVNSSMQLIFLPVANEHHAAGNDLDTLTIHLIVTVDPALVYRERHWLAKLVSFNLFLPIDPVSFRILVVFRFIGHAEGL